MSTRTDLPSPTSPNFQARLRETLQTYLGRQGNPLDRGITLRDLLETGLAELREGATLGNGSGVPPIVPVPSEGDAGGGASGEEPDLTPPPQPSGFAVSAGITHVFIEHDAPLYSQGHGHLRTHVYGAIVTDLLPDPVFADAVELTQFTGSIGDFGSNPGQAWRLWIKWESRDGVLSATPAGGTNGLAATTGQDVSSLVEAMTGAGNPFVILSEPTTIGGVLFPAGTYSAQAFIQDAQISNAKIADLAVDSAKVASLSVSKLIAGSIAVGEYAQATGYIAGSAGWRINGDGGAEFSGVVVRGTIFASAGQIGGSTIGSTYIRSTTYVLNESGWNFNSDGTGQVGGIAFLTDAMQSSNYVADTSGWRLTRAGNFEANSGTFRGNMSAGQFTTGAYTGYAWPPAGAGNIGTYLGPSGLLIGNANNGKYFQVTADGNISAPGFNVTNGTLTINQANVISTLNLQGQAVTIPAFAFTAGEVGLGFNTWTTVQSVYLTSSGAPIMIVCASDVYVYNDNGEVTAAEVIYARLLRNGTPLIQKTISQVGLGPQVAGRRPFCFFYQDTVGATGVTYTLQVYSSGSVYSTAGNRSVFALETKR